MMFGGLYEHTRVVLYIYQIICTTFLANNNNNVKEIPVDIQSCICFVSLCNIKVLLDKIKDIYYVQDLGPVVND